MCIMMNKELLVSAYIYQKKDNTPFTINDVMEYMGELWNAGCGPIIPNFTRQELWDYLHSCKSLIQECDEYFVFDYKSINPSKNVLSLFCNDMDKSIGYEILLQFSPNINIPKALLEAIGYGYIIDK